MDLNQLTSHIQKRKRDCQERVGSGVGEAVGFTVMLALADSTPVDCAAGEAAFAAVCPLAAAAFLSASVVTSAVSGSTNILMFSLFWAKSTVVVAKQSVLYTRLRLLQYALAKLST